ncbi:MAG: alpha/beta fold hydrolase [Gemmatimonadetes bacterium]|nr:alpha/beta fold hydrolase [Gemmatimonadota bacterium]
MSYLIRFPALRSPAAVFLSAIPLTLLLTAGTLHGQDATRTAAYLILRGNDTIAVERVRRSASSVTAIVASPNQPSIELVFTLGPDHAITATSFVFRGANATADAAPLQTGSITIIADSAHLEMRAGGNSRSMRLGTRPGALPVSNNDFVIIEQMARMARARGVRSLALPLFAMAGGATVDGSLEFIGADSARFKVATSVIDVALDAAGNVIGGTIPVAGLRLVVLEGAAANAIKLGRADYSAPAGAPYTAEEVTVRTPAGHLLTGTLTRPSNAVASVPAVVTITGSGAQDRDEYLPFAGGVRIFRQVADTLGRRGIAVLRLDDRGVGGSGGDVNGTSADFADDIRAGVAYLRTRPEIDPARIALVGHSEGGVIAPMVARTDAKLAAIVLMAGPAYTGRQIIDYQVRNLVMGDTAIRAAAKDSAAAAARAAFDSTSGKAPWMKFFLTYDPMPTARAVKQPVLILQGATDQQVRPEEATMLERAMVTGGNRQVTKRVFVDHNHLFLRDPSGFPGGYGNLTDPRVDSEVLGTLADWLATTLRVTPIAR